MIFPPLANTLNCPPAIIGLELELLSVIEPLLAIKATAPLALIAAAPAPVSPIVFALIVTEPAAVIIGLLVAVKLIPPAVLVKLIEPVETNAEDRERLLSVCRVRLPVLPAEFTANTPAPLLL